MATAEYRRWNAAGRLARLARPVQDLKVLAARAGVQWLGDLGNDGHLLADFPEDHTPYSYTAWPSPLPDYVVCACDMQDGPWSDRLLRDARAGRAPWLKYMNFRNNHYNRENDWDPVWSSDPHLHVSIMSNYTYQPLDGYDPFHEPAPEQPQGDDVMAVIAVFNNGRGGKDWRTWLVGNFVVSHTITNWDWHQRLLAAGVKEYDFSGMQDPAASERVARELAGLIDGGTLMEALAELRDGS